MERLTERQVIGEFYKTLELNMGASWIPRVSNIFGSDQASEEYAWLGMSPAMREWVGGRQPKGFRENGLTIVNKHYEATIDILLRELRRDKSGQAMVRIRDMATRANSHWASLLSTLVVNGIDTDCYDGQYFFDTDHSEGDSGTQSNDISVDISALPTAVAGVVTAPSVEEMDGAIAAGIQQIIAFKDDQGEPMNEDAREFLVMVPNGLYPAAIQSVYAQAPGGYQQTVLEALRAQYSIDVVNNVRLTNESWTDEFVVFRTDSEVKAFIRQEETGVDLKVKGAGSEYEFDNDAHQYGIDTWRNVGYGFWQMACLVTMT